VRLSYFLTKQLAEAAAVRVLSESASVLKWEEVRYLPLLPPLSLADVYKKIDGGDHVVDR